MYGVNKVILVGTVGKDADVHTFENGDKKATTTLATTKRGYTLKNGTQVPDQTEWHNLVINGGMAKVAEQYVKKGTNLYVEGEIHARKFTNKQNMESWVTEIHVTDMHLIPSAPKPQQP